MTLLYTKIRRFYATLKDEFGATESEDSVCVTSNSEQAVGSVLEDSGFNYSNAGDDSKSQDLHIEQSNSDPGVENNTSMNSDYGDMSEGRKRKHKADPNKWKKIKNQNLRMEGKQYLGYTKPKNKKIKQNQIRAARSLKPGCTSERCMRSKKRTCAKFTEDDILSIFSMFWSDLNWDQRNISLKQIYDLYIEICKEDGKKCLSNKTFYNQFNESNLALYQPKKDQCDTCVSYKVGNITDEQYKEHILKKNRAMSEKETDKKLAEEGKCVLLTIDLQAVKVCPFV
nr:unnamed protein product [Callosobruchus analis]